MIRSTEQSPLAVIGGSGFYAFETLVAPQVFEVPTPYGLVQGLTRGTLERRDVIFMCRHGSGHKIPPHKINYRANVWALHALGVRSIVAVNAVGGIGAECKPGALVVPHQIIDYTYGREHTYADVLTEAINHVEFAGPYSTAIIKALITAAKQAQQEVVDSGCYACTQGPRLETSAEIQRLKRDGNTIVGMTAMPEAALARELGMDYGALCIVANWAAGLDETPITFLDIHRVLDDAMVRTLNVLRVFASFY